MIIVVEKKRLPFVNDEALEVSDLIVVIDGERLNVTKNRYGEIGDDISLKHTLSMIEFALRELRGI